MSYLKPKVQAVHGVDEVRYKNHESEFRRFYENHKSFCDEISGVKPRTIMEGNSPRQFYIGRDNFIFAIRKLMAFVVDNLHYVKSSEDAEELEQRCAELENDFLSNTEYDRLVKKPSLTTAEDIQLTRMHIDYIIKTYEIGNLLVNMLQGSLMIATSTVTKNIEYFSENTFFEELSRYRTEMSDSISNYRFSDTLLQLKRIIGYHYTYKIMISKDEQKFSERILRSLIDEITKDETMALIEKFSQKDAVINKATYAQMIETHDSIKRILLKIYNITNKNLSERKILPKIIRKIHIDKTLI